MPERFDNGYRQGDFGDTSSVISNFGGRTAAELQQEVDYKETYRKIKIKAVALGGGVLLISTCCWLLSTLR